MYSIQDRHLIQKHRKKLKRANLLKIYEKIYQELLVDPLQRIHDFEILENIPLSLTFIQKESIKAIE